MIQSKSRKTSFLSVAVFLRDILPTSLLMMLCVLLCNAAAAQSLTISNSGQTGTSGTNWSTSGTNPVTITATSTANINTSVIQNYLNAGTSVVVKNNPVGTTISSNISKTSGASASLSFRDIGNIQIAADVNISSTSNALDIILWADDDNSQGGAVNDFIYCSAGVTFSSNGGKIVMAGGPDNGTNGGVANDGIPDGFAWNGSNLATYSADQFGGLTLGPRGGSGTVVSLLSNGGDIILRGSTSNDCGFPGITSQGNLKIISGTGKIIMFGKSSNGHGVELTYGAEPSIAISSSSTNIPAVDIKGTSTRSGYNGFWASNNISGNILIQSTAATNGGVTIEGTSTSGVGLWLGTSGTNIVSQVLSQTGTVTLKSQGNANNSLALYGDVFIGNRKDATTIQGVTPAVSASSANILLQANDQCGFSNASGKTTSFSSTGSFSFEAYSAGFTGIISWLGNPIFGSGISSITLGESSENYTVQVNNTVTATGNITAYASDFALGNAAGLVSTGAGNININAKASFSTAGTTRRTISTVNGNINVFADADASGDGQLNIDYLTFNAGTGTTTLRAETLSWVTTASTDKPYINGTGAFIFEPADASFPNLTSTAWFYFDQDNNGMAGLTLGKSTNTGNVTHETNALAVAGPIAIYGGIVTLTANLTSSATGDIFIKSNSNVNSAFSIAATASILKTAGSGTLTMQSQDRISSGTIAASGTGLLNVVLWSDYDNDNNGGLAITTVTTNGGHLWAGGSNSNGGTYTWNGLAVGNGPSVGSPNNNFNAIDFYGPVSTNGGQVLIWGGNGNGGGTNGIAVQAATSINAGTGNITLIADVIAGSDLTITSTGLLTLAPDNGAYPGTASWNGTISSGTFSGAASTTYDALVINNFASLGGLSIGYYNGHLLSGNPVVQGNTSAITTSIATSVAGPISLYGTPATIGNNLVSTTGGNISIFTNSLSLSGSVTLTSIGNLMIEPITAGTTIGLAGGTGTLSISAVNFTSSFTDGFSEIRIGNSAAGIITLGSALAIRDNLRLTSSGNMQLNETLDITSNDFRFVGNTIVPATNKYVKTNGTGKLIMDIASNASKLFPLGITNYHPVTITNKTGAGDTFYATASPNIYSNGGVSGTAVTFAPRVDITWNIGNTGASTGSGNVDLDFGWNASSEVGSITSPRLLHFNGSIWQQQSGTTTFDLVARTLSYTGYAGSFSPFAIAQSNVTLPVSWLSFEGRKVRNTVELKWATATEIFNDYFEIERRTESTSFVVIGSVSAIETPGIHNEYSFIDQQPLGGRSYYRIKQVDHDGKNSYSNIIGVSGSTDEGYSASVIPGTKQLLVSIPQTVAGKTDVLIYDGNGRQLMRQQVQPGRNVIYANVLNTSGIYFISIIHDNEQLYRSRFIFQF